jgi:hypothetical protein
MRPAAPSTAILMSLIDKWPSAREFRGTLPVIVATLATF